MDFTKSLAAVSSAIGARELINAASDLTLNDALGVVGLERKPSSLSQLLPAIGLITVSAAVGAGIALLLRRVQAAACGHGFRPASTTQNIV